MITRSGQSRPPTEERSRRSCDVSPTLRDRLDLTPSGRTVQKVPASCPQSPNLGSAHRQATVFTMDDAPPMMSTPISSKRSSLFCEISQLPSKLFNTYTSRDSYELDEMDPNHNTSFNSTMGRLFSTCRHSLRLLNNGYYILDEESVLCSAEGNITFSPTKPNVSYKENVVRIFRHRRRPVAPRRLNLWNKEIQPQESGLEDDNNWNRQEVDFQDNHIFSPKPTRWNRRTLTVVLFCMCLFISLLARFWMESWLST